MRKETITVFIANDGRKFNTEEECIDYESKREQFFNAIQTIKDYCYFRVECSNCPFFDCLSNKCWLVTKEPYDWNIEKLKKM